MDILHLAAPCRNVPVTFTLDIMRIAVRTIGAALLGPLILALVAALPALGSAAFFQLFVLAGAISVPLFLVCAAVCHFVLRWKQWTRLKEYAGVMFLVGTAVLLIARLASYQFIFGNGGSEFHLGTQIIEHGQFTLAGLAVLAGESMFGAFWLSLAFGLFWRLAVHERAPS